MPRYLAIVTIEVKTSTDDWAWVVEQNQMEPFLDAAQSVAAGGTFEVTLYYMKDDASGESYWDTSSFVDPEEAQYHAEKAIRVHLNEPKLSGYVPV